MKKIILLLLLSCSVYAQKDNYISFSAAIDIKNGLVGSKPTNCEPKLDVIYQFSLVDRNVEVNVSYELFNAIGFNKYSAGVGYHFKLYGYVFKNEIKTTIIPSIEPTLIGRWKTKLNNDWYDSSSHMTLGANLEIKWDLNEKLSLGIQCNALPRVDLSSRYRDVYDKAPVIFSNYFKISYKL